MSDRDSWEGTASELLALIDPHKEGIPRDAIKLSTEVMKPEITEALKTYSIRVRRGHTSTKRFLQIQYY